MMQFLKSILSSKKKEMNTKELQADLLDALKRIETLEKQTLAASNAIVELSQAVSSIALGTQELAQEFAVITALLQQASEALIKEQSLPDVTKKEIDDDGYLN